MSKHVNAVTVEAVREKYHYDPDSGVFTRLKSDSPKRWPVGGVVGINRRIGYIAMNIDGRNYQAHRLAWLYMTGSWPQHEIDHIDGNPLNNRWGNLRDVPHVVNTQNLRRVPAGKKYSRLLGAHWSKKHQRWQSSISVNGTRKYLGVFATEQEASQAYLEAKRAMHEGCTV